MAFVVSARLSEITKRHALLRSFLTYILLGGMIFLGSLSVVMLMVELVGASPALAGAVGFVASFFLNFAAARWAVFQSKGDSVVRQFASFAAVSIAMRLAEYCVYWFLITIVHLPYYFVFFIVLLISSSLKFFVYRKFVFSGWNDQGAK